MTRKIFIYAFMLGVVVLITCTAVFVGLQYKQTMEESYEALQGEASYAASGMQIGGIRFLESLENINRVTWIGKDGAVLYDSKYPGLTSNQGQFPEVRDALEKGKGRGIRRSSSEKVQTMYYAFLCEDGTILRLSRPVSALAYALRTVTPVLGVVVLLLFISGSVAFRIANAIAKPINQLDLDAFSYEEVYPELFPLVDRLKEQRETIEKETEKRERLRKEFSANVSHELKTPLTSISGFAELMRSGMCDEEKMIEFAGDIFRESQRMIALVNDIIRISQLDEGGVHTQTEEVDLLQAAKSAVHSLQHAASQRKITMTVEELKGESVEELKGESVEELKGESVEELKGETAEEPAGESMEEHERETAEEPAGGPEKTNAVRTAGSSHLIGDMIYNLCDNAVKYNREGGTVTVRVWNEGKNACVSVEDTGIGIPLEEQGRVFERFYRVDKSHSRKMGGTGLGLSIVKHAAQLYKASIEMKSEPGKGTKIILRFPSSGNGQTARE